VERPDSSRPSRRDGGGPRETVVGRRTGPSAALEAALSEEPAYVDDLARLAGMEPASTLAALLELELAGIALACAGGRYRRVKGRGG
jgi:predicted Rossmann fold nucleotide-binding protein DprA/Smf involved in DNA uptake